MNAPSTPDDLTRATGAELTQAYASGAASPVDALQAVLEVARTRGSAVNAVAVVDEDTALWAAQESAARWRADAPLGPLDGVPVSVKDSIPVAGLQRWHGSRLNADAPPSSHDGAPVRRLREAGAVVFAKTTMPDFGLLGSGVSSQFGIVRNPWDEATSPGGSSAGAAALLAVGGGPMAVGTDMGGSVRFPAALNGLVALKPTQGRVAYDPPKLIGNAGPMARSVADVANLLSVIGQPDDADHLSLPGRFEWDGRVPDDWRGVRVGVLTSGENRSLPPELEAAVLAQADLLASCGATVVPIPRPLLSLAEIEVLVAVLMTRGLPELLAAPEEHWAFLPGPLRAVLTSCLELSAADHVRHEKRVEVMRASAASVLNSFDYVVSPVAPLLAFPAEAPRPEIDGVDVGDENLVYTAPHNITSMPAGVVCVGLSTSGAPIGVQISGRRFDDGGVLSVLAHLERNRGHDVDYPFATA